MLSEEQNRLLTEVEGDAPMGRLMRENYWIPCARSESLIADGAPQRIRLLGRNYVAFRATDGRIGMFDEACPHRGVSLVLARNEDCALRCIFHSWKIHVSGKVVEVPSEGLRSATVAEKMKVNHYPTFEGGGLLWAWLGEGAPPARPPLPFIDLPADRVWVSRTISQCNWLQGLEGTLDSVHVGTLHQSWIAKAGQGTSIALALDSHPRYEVAETSYGLSAAALRKLADGRQYLRVTEYVMPFTSLVPRLNGDREGSLFMTVPIDDGSHMLFWGLWNEDAAHEREKETSLASEGARDMDNYASLSGGAANAWGQDRAAMAAGHFTGFDDCLLQEDIAVQVSMGRIVDRTREQLCSSDVAIGRARRRLLAAVHGQAEERSATAASIVVRPIDLICDDTYRWRPGVAPAAGQAVVQV
jgi:phenylpropionate dioxygenase-like ring-hydroxylating dioxygenase large terminal subunit